MTTTIDQKLQRRLNDALRKRNLDDVVALLHAGADPNGRKGTLDTEERPLFAATKAQFIPGLEALHRAGADVNASGQNDFVPLMVASSHGFVETGRWLLQHGADLKPVSLFNETGLSLALVYKQFAFVEMVFEERPRAREEDLVIAAKIVMGRREIEVAQWLLEQGVSPNLMDHKGNAWLKVAQSSSDNLTKPLVELLVKAGADVNVVDDAGSSPLHEVLRHRATPGMQQLHDSGVEPLLRLLNAGANPDLLDKDGCSVRSKIQEMRPDNEIRLAFEAWEASHAAHRVIDASAPSALRPL